jgi:hypothetical protein
VTNTRVSEEQFAAFVRGHRGDYVLESAAAVAEFAESIDRDRLRLLGILMRQVPPYNLVSNRVVPALDGNRALPAAPRVTQIVPAGGRCRIGHVMGTDIGWVGFHYLAPFKPLPAGGTEQISGVIAVFAEHFATMRRPAGE